jgi:hypothetical protein
MENRDADESRAEQEKIERNTEERQILRLHGGPNSEVTHISAQARRIKRIRFGDNIARLTHCQASHARYGSLADIGCGNELCPLTREERTS